MKRDISTIDYMAIQGRWCRQGIVLTREVRFELNPMTKNRRSQKKRSVCTHTVKISRSNGFFVCPVSEVAKHNSSILIIYMYFFVKGKLVLAWVVLINFQIWCFRQNKVHNCYIYDLKNFSVYTSRFESLEVK